MPEFKKLILIGRPASGKSELIDFLKNIPENERKEKFHIGKFYELDDFPWLWEKFTEDDIWEKAGHKRLCSKRAEHGYVTADGSVLDYCIERFNFEIKKQPTDGTTFIEFARGAPDGGFGKALNQFSDELLKDAAVLFIYTSYEESCRRNEARYQEKLKHSILAHKVPQEDQIRFAKDIDWLEITNEKSSGYLPIRNFKIPFVTMNNEPELKQDQTEALTKRYKTALDTLFQLCTRKQQEVS